VYLDNKDIVKKEVFIHLRCYYPGSWRIGQSLHIPVVDMHMHRHISTVHDLAVCGLAPKIQRMLVIIVPCSVQLYLFLAQVMK
jgi:hypothetical protein